MSDQVTRALVERQAPERGFSGSLAVSLAGHVVLITAAVVAPLLLPKPPAFQVADGFVVPLPRGGGGTPHAADPAPPREVPRARPSEKPPEPEPARAEPPPKIIKPPKVEEPRRGLPPPERSRRTRREPTPPPARVASQVPGSPTSRGTTPGATGTSNATPGLDFLPAGPGVPGGVDLNGDWYLAGIQRKIWLIWARQIQTGLTQPIRVSFTILADGSVEDVRVLEPSPVPLLNLAAQRAVISAAPFGPLPRTYGTARFTLQALFKSTS